MSNLKTERVRHPAAWVPSSYFAEGIPFALVIWVAGSMFKDLGHTDSEITVATASIGIMWSLKPLYAGFLDMLKTKKFWVLSMEFFMAGLLIVIALSLSLPSYFTVIILLLWVLAFASATQDICVDGVYITSLDEKRQAGWIGLQGAGWVTGRIFATALVVGIAGALQRLSHYPPRTAWAIAIAVSLTTMAGLGIYHYFMLPTGSIPRRPKNADEVMMTFGDTLAAFFTKPYLVGMLLFVFLYRSGEGFLLIEAPLFMQGKLTDGGLGLCAAASGISDVCPHTLEAKAWIDGLISTSVSLAAGIAGGAFIAKYGLKKTLVVMALCMNIPHICYIYLSHAVAPQAPLSLTTISILVTIEKFGYSFGFVANMLYMMQVISPGKYHMTHYAFCTAIMNLVLIPTQMASGPLADWMGYKSFFIFVLVASIPSVIAAWFAPFPKETESPERQPGALALPGARLAAATLDLYVLLPSGLLGAIAFSSSDGFLGSLLGPTLLQYLKVVAFAGAALWTVLIVVWQVRLLSARGQTIGKRWTRIRIVNADGTIPDFTHGVLLRYLVNLVLSAIPGYVLVDALFVFRSDRRCLHDMLAGTRVVVAEKDAATVVVPSLAQPIVQAADGG